MRKRKVTAYDENSRMGEGDPLRMAGLPVQPKKPGNLSKSPRNKRTYRKKQDDKVLRNLSAEELLYVPWK